MAMGAICRTLAETEDTASNRERETDYRGGNMSVAFYHQRELENLAGSLHKHLADSGFRNRGKYEKRDAYRVIAVAGIANQTAIFLTYGSDGGCDDMRNLDDSTPGTLSAKATYQQIKSLIYNCCSNDGTECIPVRYQELLETMLLSIVENAAGWRRA